MTRRICSPDTKADVEVRECLDNRRSFVMEAGAGSGKTTSLIKALAHLDTTQGEKLRRAGRQIACITYTGVAVGEILGDVGNSPVFHISTIHSFLWKLAQPFQSDIRNWVELTNPRKRPATKNRLSEEVEALEAQSKSLSRVTRFVYGTGRNYSEGILGHDDITQLTPYLARTYPLMRKIVAARFPFIFVDESQDTLPAVIEMLRQIATEEPVCVGFFGDPMQKIYPTGAGRITPDKGWAHITKRENFRCPPAVLNVVNAIRKRGDGLIQVPGKNPKFGDIEASVGGTVNVFVLPSSEHRTRHLNGVRSWLARHTGDTRWTSDRRDDDVRVLVLVHRMAARRLGFERLYSAFNDKASGRLKEGFYDGTAWPLRPFVDQLLPLVIASRTGNHFEIMRLLRAGSRRLDPAWIRGHDVPRVLEELQRAVEQLVTLMDDGSQATVRDVLQHVVHTELLHVDERFRPHLALGSGEDGGKEARAIERFLECTVTELWAYRKYCREESAYATHHGVKGAQFQRVLVVLDDEEGRHNQYSYEKYLTFAPLSDNDKRNIDAGNDSVIERTRRLFYVCCSRATKDLAIVLFTREVDAAKRAVAELGLFPEDSIHGPDVLGNHGVVS